MLNSFASCTLLQYIRFHLPHKKSKRDEDGGEWFTDPEHHWQASDLVKCVVSTFTFMHLADAFIQSDLQYIQVIHFH